MGRGPVRFVADGAVFDNRGVLKGKRTLLVSVALVTEGIQPFLRL